MITNFENITEELTAEEKQFLPMFITGMSSRDKDNPIKAPDIVVALNEAAAYYNLGITISEVRLRKLVNHIRSKGVIPLIATSKGYFVSSDVEEIKKQIQSMEERANSIMSAADGLRIFINC